MSLDRKNYYTMRQFMPEGWGEKISRYPELDTMTYLYDEEEAKEFPEGYIELTPYMLLRGTLFYWCGPWVSEHPDSAERKGFLRDILEDLRKGFGWPTLGRMILDVSLETGSRNGVLPAHSILLAGLDLLPEDTELQGNFICALWSGIELGGHRPLRKKLSLLVRMYEDLEKPGFRPEDAETMEYIYLAALYLLNRHKKWKAHFWREAGKRLKRPEIIERVSGMLADESLPVERLVILN